MQPRGLTAWPNAAQEVKGDKGTVGSAAMPAFVWKTNPRMWKVVAPFADSADALKAYICDPSTYVYWSTPRHQDEIAAGDIAYIWRTAYEGGPEGIVARGRVEEAPRQLTP